MDITLVAGAVAAISWLLWIELTATQRLMLPVLLLFGSSLALALQPAAQAFVIFGSAMRGAGLALMVFELCRRLVRRDVAGIRRTPAMRRVLWSGLGLLSIIAIHVVTSGRGALPVSPWGLFFVIVSLLYWLSIADEVHEAVRTNLTFPLAMALMSLLLSGLVVMVRAGVLAGNTTKLSMGEGGVGLAGLSTNETAAMAIAPMLWALRLLESGRPWIVRLGYMSVASSLAVVLLSGSRVGIGVCGGVLALIALRVRDGLGLRARVGVVVPLTLLVALGAFIVRARTLKEVESFESGNAVSAQFAVPGGERAILWVSYLVSFSEAARESPRRYLWGVGPAGIAEAYATSALPTLGITIDRASYYPIHSDLIELGLTTGATGLLLLALMLYWIAKLPFESVARVHAQTAAFAFAVLFTVDMLQFVPGVVAIMFASIAEVARPFTGGETDL